MSLSAMHRAAAVVVSCIVVGAPGSVASAGQRQDNRGQQAQTASVKRPANEASLLAPRKGGDPNRRWPPDLSAEQERLYELGCRAIQKEQVAEARKHFEALIATDPNDARIWNNIATQYMQCRYTSDAQGIILLGWAREHLRKAIELRPRYPDPFMNMGIIELRSGNFAQANEILRKGLAMPLPDGAARIANRLGMVWWEVGRPLDALSYFRDALRMDSNLADAHNNEGFILDLLGFDAEAMASYRKAIALEPNHADAHFNVGTLYMKGKDPNRAVAEIERSIALNPGSAKGHLALAQLLDSQGKTVEALASVRKTIKIDSNMVPALILVASILATHPDSNIRDGDHALLYAQKASRLTGMTDPAILDVLAAAYAETGDYTLAAETARKAVELLKQQGQEAQAAQVVERLRLYEAGKPYRRAAQ